MSHSCISCAENDSAVEDVSNNDSDNNTEDDAAESSNDEYTYDEYDHQEEEQEMTTQALGCRLNHGEDEERRVATKRHVKCFAKSLSYFGT